MLFNKNVGVVKLQQTDGAGRISDSSSDEDDIDEDEDDDPLRRIADRIGDDRSVSDEEQVPSFYVIFHLLRERNECQLFGFRG